MDARQLSYFLAVVDHGGFKRAADHLFIAQPSLSQAIAAPSTSSVSRSSIGWDARCCSAQRVRSWLVGPARLVLRDLAAARASVDAVRDVRGGRLDLSSMPSHGIEPLTTLMTTFIDRHPHVAVNVDGAFTPEDVVAAVRSGACEIGLAGGREPFRVAGVDVLPIEEQPLVVIVGPTADRFGDGDTVQREALAGRRFIVSQQGSLMRWLIDNVLAHGIDCEIVVEVAHRTSILPMVLAGVGHTVLPSSWSPLAHSSGLRTLTVEPASYLHVAVLSRSSGLTPAARAFLVVAAEYADGVHRA